MKSFLALVPLVFATSLGYAADAPTAAPAASPVIGLPAAPAPTPSPAPERIEAAKVLMTNMHFADTLAKVLDSHKESMVRMIDQSTMMMPPGSASAEDKAAYKKDMLETYNSAMTTQACLDGMVNVYASLFTVDELNGMAGFYGSPAGQALVAKTFELQQKSGEVLQKQMQIVMPQLQAKQKAFVAAHPAKTAPAPPLPKTMTPGAQSAAAPTAAPTAPATK
jgi:hypothetical protein